MRLEEIILIGVTWALSVGVTVGRAIKRGAPDPGMWGFIATFLGPLALIAQTALYLAAPEGDDE